MRSLIATTLMLSLAACGHNTEQRAATGAVHGLVLQRFGGDPQLLVALL